MSSVGLLYVGAVLMINGLMLLGVVPGKAAAAMNLFVGAMQVVFPTIILAQSDGDPGVILGASGLFLFGFTYLYVAWNLLTGAPGEGLGWFSLFVAACAAVYGTLNFVLIDDPLFGVIWFSWAVLWFMFFVLLGLGKDSIQRRTGWFTLFLGIFTGAVPSFLLLTQNYPTGDGAAMIGAALAVGLFIVAWLLGAPNRVGISREKRPVNPATRESTGSP